MKYALIYAAKRNAFTKGIEFWDIIDFTEFKTPKSIVKYLTKRQLLDPFRTYSNIKLELYQVNENTHKIDYSKRPMRLEFRVPSNAFNKTLCVIFADNSYQTITDFLYCWNKEFQFGNVMSP